MRGNSILIKGKQYAVDSNIQLELHNPFFDRSTVVVNGETINPRGQFSQAFTKSDNGDFRKAIDGIDLLQVRGRNPIIDGVTLYSDGMRIDKGQLMIHNVDMDLNTGASRIDMNFFYDYSRYLDLIADKKITDLVLSGVIRENAPAKPAWMNPLDASINGIVWGTDASGEPNPFINSTKITDTASDIIMNGHEWIAFPELQIDAPDGAHYYGNVWSGNTLGRILTYTSLDVTLLGGTVTRRKFTPLDNVLVIPMFYYRKVLEACFTEFGYTLKGDLLNDATFNSVVFENEYSILKRLVIEYERLHSDNTANGSGIFTYWEEDFVVNPINHLPDVTIAELLQDCMFNYNCFFEFNGNEVTIVNNRLNKLQKRIEKVSRLVKQEFKEEKGLYAHYEYPDRKEYEAVKQIKTLVDKLPDVADLAGLNDGDLLIDKAFNYIDEKYTPAAADLKIKCDNLIPYYSGKATELSIKLTPVTQKVLVHDMFSSYKCLVAYTTAQPHRWTDDYYYYEFGGNDGGVTNGSGFIIYTDTYDQTDVQYGEEVEGDGTAPIIGIYHGLMGTMDMAAHSKVYPYMSNHNYQPLNTGANKIGDWHLGLLNDESRIAYWYGYFLNVFNAQRKVTFEAELTYYDIKQLRFEAGLIVRDNLYYIGAIKFELPLRALPQLELWEI